MGYGAPQGENRVRATILVTNVDLWWPVGYGAQPLYSLTATFTPSSALRDDHDHDRPWLAPVSADRQVGFRTVELVTDKYSNQKGSSMFFRVNGVRVCACVSALPTYGKSVRCVLTDRVAAAAAAAGAHLRQGRQLCADGLL
jgi:hypothetical protein